MASIIFKVQANPIEQWDFCDEVLLCLSCGGLVCPPGHLPGGFPRPRVYPAFDWPIRFLALSQPSRSHAGEQLFHQRKRESVHRESWRRADWYTVTRKGFIALLCGILVSTGVYVLLMFAFYGGIRPCALGHRHNCDPTDQNHNETINEYFQ